jgi:DNA-binding transcriptional ArsR family regulator
MLDEGQTAELAEVFHLLGDATRLRIVLACLAAPVSVSALAERVGASSSLVSHHLRLLRAARILRAERRGKHVFYSAADAHIRDVLTDMIEHIAEAAEDMV